MPDPRFYDALGPAALGELIALTGARSIQPGMVGRSVVQAAVLARADEVSVTYFADRRYESELASTRAAACFISSADAARAPEHCVALVTDLPQAAYATAADRLHRPRRHEAGAGPIHPEASVEDGVALGPGVVVGPGATVGRGTYICASAVIGPGVVIGEDCYVGAGASIGFALIGDRVRVHAGAVIGEPGFGAAAGAHGLVDVPQLGRVIIHDGVSIGSGSCIDRGAWDDTVVGENTKIDNLVQIAHNVVIGCDCLLAAYTGISGSATVGDGCMFGGRAGVTDHVTIGAGARIAAAAGVMRDVPAGESWGGHPARPMKRWLRETAWLARAAQRRHESGNEP
ncbi:MAG: UDP-3-O-(3-hydroxymyristoyl)glucosamine N-acyltransferase [Caulobacteraceae bacterium]